MGVHDGNDLRRSEGETGGKSTVAISGREGVVKWSVLLLVACLVPSGAQLRGWQAGPPQPEPPRGRLMVPQKGTALASRLLQGDTVVDLKWIQSDPLTGTGPVGTMASMLNMLLRNEQLALVDVLGVEAFETKELGWIRRTARAVIVEKFRGAPGRARKSVELILDGGELVINGVVVRTDRYDVLLPGSRYLVAFAANRELGGLSPTFWARRAEDGRLIAFEQSTGVWIETSLQGENFDTVVESLRMLAR